MKIAVNVRFLLKDQLEGVGWVSYELLRRIVVQHPDDEFIFLFDRPYDSSFVFGPNVRPIVISPQARHPLLWYWWFEISLPRALKKIKPDLFFSLDGYTSLRLQIPSVMIIHDIAHQHFPEQVPPVSRRYYHHFVPRFLHRVEQVITVSNFTKTDIIRRYGTPEEKIKVVYNGSRAGFRPYSQAEQEQVRAQYAEGQDYFFYVGAVHPRKNIHRLIAAFDQYKNKTGTAHKLLIGGRFAWQTGAVRSAFEAARHQKDIDFLGYLSEEELFGLMGSAAAFVYLSVFEGFGLPVLEAFHAEVPVITADRSSLPEVAGEAALLVDPEDIDAIVEAMEKITGDKSLRAQLIQAARKQRQLFDWDRAAAEVYTSLQEVYKNNLL